MKPSAARRAEKGRSPPRISSDEAGDSPSTEERLRVLRREWVQAVGTAARGLKRDEEGGGWG